MYEVRTYNAVKRFRKKSTAKKYLIKSGRKRYSALYNKNNKLLEWRSPTGLR